LRNEPSGDRPGGLFYAVRAASKAALRQSWILRGPLCPDERTSLDVITKSEKCQEPTFAGPRISRL
jgi:hypothetical protein